MFNFNKIAPDVLAEDASASLLAKVDFKWLMAGQGWWIDPKRFQCDPLYAAGWLSIALASPSFALRARAASIQNQIGRQASW